MKSYLLDIVQHTHGLGFIDLVKLSVVDNETTINAISEDQTVIVEGKFKECISEIDGVYGMPNLSKLSTILNIPEYKEGAVITANKQNKNGEEYVVGIHFENKTGDFKNDYRFMSTDLVNDKLKPLKFKGVAWNVDFVPTVNNIQRFKFQASANSEEKSFTAVSESKGLVFYFGDSGNHAGNFVFSNEEGDVAKKWSWPVAQILNILSLPGDKTYKISNEGASMITVDSGLCEYKYIIPALRTK